MKRSKTTATTLEGIKEKDTNTMDDKKKEEEEKKEDDYSTTSCFYGQC